MFSFPIWFLLFLNPVFAQTFDSKDALVPEPSVSAVASPAITPVSTEAPFPFSVDPRLQKNLDFWIRIYTQYSTNQGLIHDAKYIDHVYEVMEFRQNGKNNHRFVAQAKRKWKELLHAVHRKQHHPETLTAEEKKVFDLFSDITEPNKFLNAAHRRRLRFQLGQKDRFLDGLQQSGKYLPAMEEIFQKQNMPLQLTRLPFVESSFNLRARSKVGASGIWQFIHSTGRIFLKINPAVDERNDPIRATEAAAKLLRQNYTSLGKWPLAVTAYNHGRKGMMRAVRKVGADDLGEVVSDYHSRSFGFASSNFYTEFMAAVEVERNADKYFGKIVRDQSIQFIEAPLPDYIGIRELATHMNYDLKVLRGLNPGLTEAVYAGHLLIPAGYHFRVPYSGSADKGSALKGFWEEYSKVPGNLKLRAQRISKYVTKERPAKKRQGRNQSF
jgi:membrane-bound lytic murein transglycosylase D